MPYRRRMRHDQIALQLYTVRQAAAADLAATLDAVARIGYRAVEIAGLPDVPPATLADQLRGSGLRPVTAHVGIDRLRAAPGAVAEEMTVLGCPRVVVPWLPEADRTSVDAVRRFAGELGEIAERFAAAGLAFGYHNHAFEFAPLEDTTVWDVLLEALPPSVDLEVDVYWVAIGGADPATEVARAGERARSLHMKDLALDPEAHDAPSGAGSLDFPAIVAAGRAVGVDWYISEQDDADDPLEDAATAFAYLRSLAI